jgi:hypothetical protein
MAAGDATKTLLTAKSGRRIVTTHLVYHVLTTAAQSCDVAAGTTTVKRIGVSEAVGSEGFLGPMEFGLQGERGQALIATPSAAGYAIHFVAEGYYD